MQKHYKKGLATITLCSLMQVAAAEQVVVPHIETSGDIISVTPSYLATAPQTGNETGLGLRLHFNSSEIQFTQITGLFTSSSLGVSNVQYDTENWDQDENTDKIIIASWLDVNSQWPGLSESSPNLYKAEFTKKTGFSGTANIHFSASSHDARGEFRAEQACIAPKISISALQTVLEEEKNNSTQINFTLDTPWPDNCGELSVNYQVLGAADSSDYSLTSQGLSFSAGEQQAKLTLYILDDNTVEEDENLSFTLLPHDANKYVIDTDNEMVNITLRSDDIDPNEPPNSLNNALNIPTLSEWMILLMSLVLGGVALINHRKGDNKK